VRLVQRLDCDWPQLQDDVTRACDSADYNEEFELALFRKCEG
jgi:hypothetical protein